MSACIKGKLFIKGDIDILISSFALRYRFQHHGSDAVMLPDKGGCGHQIWRNFPLRGLFLHLNRLSPGSERR